MPSNTAGGWPYPLPAEPVREGAVNIKALADQAEKRLAAYSVVPMTNVALFNENGLWYYNWSSLPVTWSGPPTVVAMVQQTTTLGDAGVNLQTYSPHTNATTLVLQANYVKDGRIFTGNIGIYVIAVGRKA